MLDVDYPGPSTRDRRLEQSHCGELRTSVRSLDQLAEPFPEDIMYSDVMSRRDVTTHRRPHTAVTQAARCHAHVMPHSVL